MIFRNFLIKLPSAWLPLVMSCAALILTLGYLVIVGIPEVPAEDEGTAAHLFQLLMGGQVPIIVYFMVRHFPENQKAALQTLVLQIIMMFIAFLPVYLLEL